jgi:hypothetical protein
MAYGVRLEAYSKMMDLDLYKIQQLFIVVDGKDGEFHNDSDDCFHGELITQRQPIWSNTLTAVSNMHPYRP